MNSVWDRSFCIFQMQHGLWRRALPKLLQPVIEGLDVLHLPGSESRAPSVPRPLADGLGRAREAVQIETK